MSSDLHSRAAEVVERADGDAYLHHLLFCRFLLGERLPDAAWMARMAVSNDFHLPDVDEMVYVAERWSFPEPPARRGRGAA